MTGIHATTPFDRLRANGGTRPIMVSLSNHRLRANGVAVLLGSGGGGYRANGGGR